MTNISCAPRDLSDRDLLTHITRAAEAERHATAHLIGLLAELDARRLYLGEGCSCLFTYCTQVLRLSEHAAYNRIEIARAARRFPLILDLVEAGAITLTNVRLLAPHLTDANHRELLERARHKMKRDVELLVATIRPSADVPTVVRKLPTPLTKPQLPVGPDDAMKHDAAVSSSEAEPSSTRAEAEPIRTQPAASVKPLSPERYKIQVTVSCETYAMLRRAQDLMRHSLPNGDPAVIIARALELLVGELQRKKMAATDRPDGPRAANTRSRHIPAELKRTVWQRATKVAADFSVRAGAARKPDFSNITTSYPMQTVDKRLPVISNFDVARTIDTRPTFGLVRLRRRM